VLRYFFFFIVFAVEGKIAVGRRRYYTIQSNGGKKEKNMGGVR
jgi:hypothetical protein